MVKQHVVGQLSDRLDTLFARLEHHRQEQEIGGSKDRCRDERQTVGAPVRPAETKAPAPIAGA